MRVLIYSFIVSILLFILGCSEETVTDPDDGIRPTITDPLSGRIIHRLKLSVSGTAEPDRAVEIILDDLNNSTVVYADHQGHFALQDLSLGGQGGRVIWARMANDTSLVSHPVVVNVDFSWLTAPLILFPPHEAKIPATQIPVSGLVPPDVSEVEIYRNDALIATVAAEDGAFFWSGLDPVGSGRIWLWTRGLIAGGGYTSYGESIYVSLGGGENPSLGEIQGPAQDAMISASGVVVRGTAIGEHSLVLYMNGGDTGLRADPVDGDFVFQSYSLLEEGPAILGIATIREQEVVAEGCVRITVDRIAPYPPTFLRPSPGELYRSGGVAVEGASEAGAVVHICVDDEWVDTLSVSSTGAVACTLSLPGDGQYRLAGLTEDLSGNQSTLSTELLVVVDQSAPAAPSLLSPSAGELIMSESFSISGEADIGSWLEVLLDGGIIAAMEIDGQDAFELTIPSPSPDGTHCVSVRASSEPGAGWVRGDSVVIYVDLIAPAAPIILYPPESTLVAQATISVAGAAEPNASVILLVDGVGTSPVMADQQGTWERLITCPSVDGAMVLQASSTDSAGHAGPMSSPYVLIIDQTPPDLTIDEPDQGALLNESPVLIKGQAEVGALVWIDGSSVSIDDQGSFERSVSLSEGVDSVIVSAADAAGNRTSLPLIVRLDTTAPFIELISPSDSLITQSTHVTVEGTTEIGASVTVQGAPVSVDATGAFNSVVGLTHGWNKIEIRAEDQAGWTTQVTRTVIVDAVPSEPEHLAPTGGALVSTGRPILSMDPASDANGDVLKYSIEVYEDEGLERLVASSPDLFESTGDIVWVVQPELSLDGAVYYWRGRAFDGVLPGPWSETASFTMPDIGSRDPHGFFGYGDSITEGAQKYGGMWIPTVGYREDLELALSVFLGGAVVDRTYIPAGATADGVANIESDLADENEGYLLLLFGVIDALNLIDPQQSASNISFMVQYAKSTLGMIVVVGTLPPNLNPEVNDRVIELNALIAQAAQEQGFLLADHYSAMVEAAMGDLSDVLCEDGTHPSDLGYSVMAETWYKAIIGSDDFPLPLVAKRGSTEESTIATVLER